MRVPRFHAYPIALQTVYKDYVWGGDRLATRYGRQVPVSPCAESWEVSDRDQEPCAILNGTYRGMLVRDWLNMHGPAVTGNRHAGERLPLLVKLIDARENLSVQVHPNNNAAGRFGGEAKSEMWYVLDCGPDAHLYAGMQPGVTRDRFMQAIQEKRLCQDVLAAIPARKGLVVYMPGGRVHAIGADCLILEVQQNSNTTYRIYDWDRKGADGHSRTIHPDQALRIIDWEHSEPEYSLPDSALPQDPVTWQSLMTTRWFNISRATLQTPASLPPNPETLRVLFIESGTVSVKGGGLKLTRGPGSTCLLPAALEDAVIVPDGQAPATVIRIET